jgi:hypothetical protein
MSGSDHSGEDMEAGRFNQAEDTTRIWAQRTDSDDGDDFTGNAILIVEPTGNVDDPEDYLDNDWKPQHPLDGVVATGWSANRFISGNIGGVGVIGNGGNNQGTGVLGRGGGEGVGGIGVHGIGGSQDIVTWDPTDPPGTGVLGQGGRQALDDLRLPHGAGVVGLAGGNKKPIPPLADTDSVGVYGQGAEAEVQTINIDGVNTVVGPMAPGPGVLGRGGVPIPAGRDPVAAGVIGLAGDTPIPPISETGNNGVYGTGPVGVFGGGYVSGVRGKSGDGRGVLGETDSDIGVFGSANKDTGRGGAFQSEHSAQLWLVPQNQPVEINERLGPKLPRDGRGGDLMAIADRQGECTLWFCIRGMSGAGPARWAQVLLGSPFDGQL